jgi:hypothetical protein
MTETEWVVRIDPPVIRQPVRRHCWQVGCGVGVGLMAAGAVALGWYYLYECQRRPTVAQIQSLVDTSGPPNGASVEEVKGWLDAHGILNREESLSWREWNTPTAEDAGGPEVKQAERVVMGFFWDAYVDPVFKGDIFVFFYFDADGRLFKTVVKGWSRCG